MFLKNRGKSGSSTRFVAVELAEDVESGDEADEAQAHDEDDGGSDLQARSVVGVEPQHVASVSGTATSAAEATGAGGGGAATAHAGCGGGRTARGHAADGSRAGGG